MPRYHFNLIDCRTVVDEGGAVLEDDIAAADVAYRFAAERSKVRPELRGKGYAILVTNANGEEVHRAPIFYPPPKPRKAKPTGTPPRYDHPQAP
jgi:hypothetical protein